MIVDNFFIDKEDTILLIVDIQEKLAAATEAAKNAKVVSNYTFSGPNQTPSETWATGVRTPYGMAFSPSGELWEVEHGPRAGHRFAS